MDHNDSESTHKPSQSGSDLAAVLLVKSQGTPTECNIETKWFYPRGRQNPFNTYGSESSSLISVRLLVVIPLNRMKHKHLQCTEVLSENCGDLFQTIYYLFVLLVGVKELVTLYWGRAMSRPIFIAHLGEKWSLCCLWKLVICNCKCCPNYNVKST